jgi:hypothetical protein
MSPIVGWVLAAVALMAGWSAWRWQGVVLALTVIAFWLILQFNRALRIMRRAASAPVGHVDSAVMLNARLRRGMPLWQVVSLTRSLGRPLDGNGDRFGWIDAGGSEVRLALRRGRLEDWRLVRPD